MTQLSASNTSTPLDRVMEPDQFDQVIEAILAGKYSWACVLILQFGGYNPLHYIPYRTYNRIVKEHCQAGRKEATTYDSKSQKPHEIKDLNYLEAMSESRSRVKGGTFATLEQWLEKRVQEISSFKKVELVRHNNQNYQNLIY